MSLSFSSHDWAKLPEMPALPAHLQACNLILGVWVNSTKIPMSTGVLLARFRRKYSQPTDTVPNKPGFLYTKFKCLHWVLFSVVPHSKFSFICFILVKSIKVCYCDQQIDLKIGRVGIN